METLREYFSEKGSGSIHTECVGDFVLPDYNTDVKRVLLTKVTAVDNGCFLSGDSVDASGVVNYEVVYIDSDGEITSCKFSTDFDASMKCNGDTALGCEATTRVVGYSVRLVGPRKFSVKAQLSVNVNLTEKAQLTVDGTSFTIGQPEIKDMKSSVAYRTYASALEREYSEKISTLDGVIADDVTILYSDVLPELNATAVDGSVDVFGMLHVNTLVMRNGEVPTMITTDVSVNERLSIDEIPDGASLTPASHVRDLNVCIEPTEEGVELIAKFNVEYCASAVGNAQLPIILDCYLTDRGVDNTYEGFNYREHISGTRISENLQFFCTWSELGLESVREILVTNAYMRTDEISVTKSGAKIGGTIRFSGVACQINDDGGIGYIGIKQDLPFSVNVNLDCKISEESRFLLSGYVCSSSAFSTPEGIEISARLTGVLDAFDTNSLTRLACSYADSEELEKPSSTITVYYPVDGETLFDVGRKFHTRPIEIAADNTLTEEAFASEDSDLRSLGVKRLIIR